MSPIQILERLQPGERIAENDLLSLSAMTRKQLQGELAKHTPPGARKRLIREKAARDYLWWRLYLTASDLT